jgi:hypothetical protein
MWDEIALLHKARPPAEGPSPELVHRAKQTLSTRITAQSSSRRRSRRSILPIAVALALAAAVVGVSLVGRGGETAWAAELVRVAQAAPRLLVGDPGWKVTRADQFSADFGEMTFSDGDRVLELRWQPAQEYQPLVRDRAASSDLRDTAPVEGVQATLFRYEGTNDFTAIWLHGRSVLEARGIASDVAEFRTALAALHAVDVDAWLSAMPESVVKPQNRAEVVEEMLAGIPLPPGFDVAALRRGDAVRDRYQLGAQVAGAVACAWIERWVAAGHAGDEAVTRGALEAMATSRSWPVLREMEDEGDYPEVLWEYADAMAANAAVMGGKQLTVEESYKRALGCS